MTPRLTVVDPVESPEWDALARSHGSLFSSPPWIGALRDTYGFESEAWVVRDAEGYAVAGMPVMTLGSHRWRRLSTLPFSDFCNPIDTTGEAWPVLANELVSRGLPAEIRVLGEEAPVTEGPLYEETPADLWHGVTLDCDEERAWAALPGSARRAIRKARDSDFEIRVTDDLGSLHAFYDLHLGTRKHKYRLLAQPYELFTSFQKRFGEDMALLGAWRGPDLIAGILLLVWRDTLYYKFNASSPRALELRPNDLLMWHATRLGVTRNLLTLDLGRTDADHESLARYKSKYATTERALHTLRLGRFRRDPAVGEILGPMTQLLTRPEVPDAITEEAGALVYHHFA